jgi:hypothetical protein
MNKSNTKGKKISYERKDAKHTAAGIPTWSPTVVLICRSTAYVWQSGRDAQFSADCGRMCMCLKTHKLCILISSARADISIVVDVGREHSYTWLTDSVMDSHLIFHQNVELTCERLDLRIN